MTSSSHLLSRAGLRALIALAAAIALFCAVAAGPAQSAHAGSVDNAIAKLRKHHDISKSRARWALRSYAKAIAVRKKLSVRVKGHSAAAKKRRRELRARRAPVNWQITNVERMAKHGRISRTRVTPLFTTMKVNAAWFSTNGPRPYGADRRFHGSRIIYRYFNGSGWQFHPLANFAKLNADWTIDTPPARRAQRAFAKELLKWATKRGHALVWEYDFSFQGSPAPWISALSQGTAIQALARVGFRFNNQAMLRAAKRGLLAFDTPASAGVRLRMDDGFHYLGYSGNKKLIILNMFLGSLVAIHDYALISNDRRGRYLYAKGLVAAEKETPKFDTGSSALYSLSGEVANAHYLGLTIDFLNELCKDTKEDVFCNTRDKFKTYQ